MPRYILVLLLAITVLFSGQALAETCTVAKDTVVIIILGPESVFKNTIWDKDKEVTIANPITKDKVAWLNEQFDEDWTGSKLAWFMWNGSKVWLVVQPKHLHNCK